MLDFKGQKQPVGSSWRLAETTIKIKEQWKYLYDANTEIRQRTYLNNLAEQDHRAIKRIVQPLLGFQTFRSAHI